MGAPRKPADSTNPVDRPDSWEKAVLAAYVRMTGGTQKEAAALAGCSVRSIHDWEHCDWWGKATEEGLSRWLKDGDAQARRVLLKSLEDSDDATTARWWAERRIKELSPPKQQVQVEVTHEEWLRKINENSDTGEG